MEQERGTRRERALFVLVSTHCDIACTYCFYTTGHERRDKNNILSRNLTAVVAAIAGLNFSTVILTGGDPLNRRDKLATIDLTKALTDRGLRVIVNTSAAYLTPADCELLAAAKPFRVDVSIDSHDADVHNSQRGRFSDAVDAIRALSSLGVTVQTTTVVTARNAPDLIETIRFLQACGASIQKLQPAYLPTQVRSIASGRATDRLVMHNETRDTISKLLTSPAETSYVALWERYWGDGVDELPMMPFCRMGKSLFVSNSEGVISGCFHRPEVQLGNLFEDSPTEIESKITASELYNEPCPSCLGSHCVSLFDSADSWVPRSRTNGLTAAVGHDKCAHSH